MKEFWLWLVGRRLPRFAVGDRVWVLSPDWNADAGWEQPEGIVVAPGRYTLVMLDSEYAEFADERLREYPEKYLMRVPVSPMAAGFMTRRQAE